MQKELKDIERDKESGVRVELIGNSIRHLTGYVKGLAVYDPKIEMAFPSLCSIPKRNIQRTKSTKARDRRIVYQPHHIMEDGHTKLLLVWDL